MCRLNWYNGQFKKKWNEKHTHVQTALIMRAPGVKAIKIAGAPWVSLKRERTRSRSEYQPKLLTLVPAPRSMPIRCCPSANTQSVLRRTPRGPWVPHLPGAVAAGSSSKRPWLAHQPPYLLGGGKVLNAFCLFLLIVRHTYGQRGSHDQFGESQVFQPPEEKRLQEAPEETAGEEGT